MVSKTPIKRRGFIMTGGGAKGLYEAGVINAFHLAGMEFDVITGSSIGAFNSLFYAEYQYQKRQLSAALRQDPLAVIEKLEPMVRSYYHAWLRLPERKVIDDSEGSSLEQMKSNLAKAPLSLSRVIGLAWWYSDPQRGDLPLGMKLSLARLGLWLAGKVGMNRVWALYKAYRGGSLTRADIDGVLRLYLSEFGLEYSVIPSHDDSKLRSVFSEPTPPLRRQHLQPGGLVSLPDDQISERGLLPENRTLKDYADAEFEVRLTRANYRTGRLELSAYVSNAEFVRYLQKQAWRIRVYGRDKLPLGSYRLMLPGNPNAINAALASGRFPAVLAPYPVSDIYPQSDPENILLYRLLAGWLSEPEVKTALQQAFELSYGGDSDELAKWQRTYQSWQESDEMREFFPKAGDIYVDGGAIDNTPANSAIDSTREWLARSKDASRRNVLLDLYMVYLETEPKIAPDDAKNPPLYAVLQRTLAIVNAAKQSTSADTVQTINTFGKRGRKLGNATLALLDTLAMVLDQMDDAQDRLAAEAHLRSAASQRGLSGFLGDESGKGILERMTAWANDQVDNALPVLVNEIKIYPEAMPLDTLQFTERLGYRYQNALEMLTMGCYHTLWAMRKHFEDEAQTLDEQDRQSLELVKQWTGIAEWPQELRGQEQEYARQVEDLRKSWQCRRAGCVFHAHCRRGAKLR